MKLNKIFMALAAMAIVGCSSEDVSDFTAKQATNEDSRLIELNPNFVLAGVGEEGNITRTHWDQDAVTKVIYNEFLPIYNATAAGGQKLDAAADLEAQAVGLCWLGNGAVGTDVYTNYQFYHFGWLNKGETEADVECNELNNGSLYSDITPLAAVTNGAGGEADPTLDFAGAIPGKSLKAGVDNLNYNTGVYQTKNKSIFGGQYIVYYPFNEDFKEAGTIPAIATTTFNKVPETFKSPVIGHATFRYSAPVTIEGGDQAADFGLYNLSSLVQLRVATPVGDAAAGVETIDQIVLYSASEKLLKQANLAADKIVAGQKGAALYASTEGTKTITANFTAPVTLQATNSTAPKPTSAYVTVLPTTVDDLVVLVHSKSLNQWARVDKANTVFEAGNAQRLDITVAKTDFKSEFIAVDDASLQTALTEARLVATAANPVSIEVIGDITLATTPFNINAAADANITIKGGDIIVPEAVTLNLNTNMESDVRVLGKSCCSAAATGGRLRIIGGTVNNVTMEPAEAKVTDLTYDAYSPRTTFVDAGTAVATIAAGKTFDVQAGNVDVDKAVQHKGNIKIAEGAKLTVTGTADGKHGDIQFMGCTVENNGTIEVKKGGKFDTTDADGNATAADGKRMTNNGTFIHNVDAGVGTAVQSMVQNGEYRCKVDDQVKLDDAYLQWTACSVIEMVNAGAINYNLVKGKGVGYKHNDKWIDIEVNNTGGVTTFNNPGATDGDSEDIATGNLTVTAGGLNIDFVQGKGKRSLTVNGDMTVKAATQFVDSKAIAITGNLTVDGATLTYKGKKANEGGLAITKNVTVSNGTFDAGSAAADVDALNITCANFYLEKAATATFGNRTDGGAKNLVVGGTIDNPEGCTFNIVAANQDGAGSVLAWVTCKSLLTGGNFSAARPRVVE